MFNEFKKDGSNLDLEMDSGEMEMTDIPDCWSANAREV